MNIWIHDGASKGLGAYPLKIESVEREREREREMVLLFGSYSL